MGCLRTADVRVRNSADSAAITVSFRLFGKMTINVDSAESHNLGELATAIVRGVRDMCAPASPAADSCRVSGNCWTKGCGAAG